MSLACRCKQRAAIY